MGVQEPSFTNRKSIETRSMRPITKINKREAVSKT